jgi:hypothetical protein
MGDDVLDWWWCHDRRVGFWLLMSPPADGLGSTPDVSGARARSANRADLIKKLWHFSPSLTTMITRRRVRSTLEGGGS